MVTKTKMDSKQSDKSVKDAAALYKESVQKIWLAGLGAFGKAQEQGGKVFEALVKEGVALQEKTQSMTKESLSDMTGKVTQSANALRDEMLAKANTVRDEVLAKTSTFRDEMMEKTSNQWGKLEGLFEERVAKALKVMGMPTQKDIDELHKRIDALAAGKSVPAKSSAQSAVKSAAKSAVKPAAKPAVKQAAKPATKAAAKPAAKKR